MKERIKELLFSNRSAKQTVAKNIFWLSTSQIAGRLIRAGVIIYAARILGAAEYGIFSYALGLAGFFTIFADIGVSSIMTREIAKKPSETSGYFATSFWIKNVLLLGTILAIVFVAPYFSKIDDATSLIPFVALLVIFDNFREFINAFFRAKEKMELEALVNISMNIAITVIGFVILYFTQTAKAITIAYVGSAGFGLLVAAVMTRNELLGTVRNFNEKFVKPILKSAWPMAILSLLGIFMFNLDIVMLGWFRSAEEIGQYSAAQRIVYILFMLPAIISNSIFPSLSKSAGENDKSKVSRIMEKSVSLSLFLAIPITVGGIVLGGPIMDLIYGSEYFAGALVFQILILTVLINFPSSMALNLIMVYDRQRKMANYVIVTSAINFVLNLVLIPKFGIAGAAIATLVAHLIYRSLAWRMIKKINDFKTLVFIKKITIAAVVMGIFSFLLETIGIPVLANIAASALLYFAGLYLMKEPLVKEFLLTAKAIKR